VPPDSNGAWITGLMRSDILAKRFVLRAVSIEAEIGAERDFPDADSMFSTGHQFFFVGLNVGLPF
jgi:hypothetical protein